MTLRVTCSIQATQLEFSLTSVNYSGSKNTTAGLMHGTSSGSGGPRGHFQVLLLSILNVMNTVLLQSYTDSSSLSEAGAYD